MYIKIKGNNNKNYGFVNVNANTKKAKSLISSYINSNFLDTELYHVYDNYSTKKAAALLYCKDMQKALHGVNGHIVSHNSQFFTYAFEFICDNSVKLAYITAYNNYIVNGL